MYVLFYMDKGCLLFFVTPSIIIPYMGKGENQVYVLLYMGKGENQVLNVDHQVYVLLYMALYEQWRPPSAMFVWAKETTKCMISIDSCFFYPLIKVPLRGGPLIIFFITQFIVLAVQGLLYPKTLSKCCLVIIIVLVLSMKLAMHRSEDLCFCCRW